jgi:hypothetical protein
MALREANVHAIAVFTVSGQFLLHQAVPSCQELPGVVRGVKSSTQELCDASCLLRSARVSAGVLPRTALPRTALDLSAQLLTDL